MAARYLGWRVLSSRVVNRLRAARGGVVSWEELVEACYGDDPSGGALWAKDAIRITVYRLRKKGFPIGLIKTRGYFYDAHLTLDDILDG